MNTLASHIETYVNSHDNTVSYWVAGALEEYLTDYASIFDGASYEDVAAALNTLDDNVFGEYESYREVVEAMLEAQGADPIPNWVAIDYKQTWEADLRHMLNVVGDTYNTGNGYYFHEH